MGTLILPHGRQNAEGQFCEILGPQLLSSFSLFCSKTRLCDTTELIEIIFREFVRYNADSSRSGEMGDEDSNPGGTGKQ